MLTITALRSTLKPGPLYCPSHTRPVTGVCWAHLHSITSDSSGPHPRGPCVAMATRSTEALPSFSKTEPENALSGAFSPPLLLPALDARLLCTHTHKPATAGWELVGALSPVQEDFWLSTPLRPLGQPVPRASHAISHTCPAGRSTGCSRR